MGWVGTPMGWVGGRVETAMVVHAGGHYARLAPDPGNLLYQIGTYIYQLAIACGREALMGTARCQSA